VKNLAEFVASRRLQDVEQAELPDSGLCINCGADLSESQTYSELRVCQRCRYHYSIGAHRRIELLADAGSFRERDRSLISVDPLNFRAQEGYRRRVQEEQRRTGLSDAVVAGAARIAGRPVVLAVIDFRFMGGSVGCAAGEKLARAIEQGARSRTPVVMVIASTGIRFQEGVLALMQLAKVAGAARKLAAAAEPLITVLANPCLGGAFAMLGNLGDLVVAEPGALIGYATNRVVEQSTGHPAAEGSRAAEALLERGLIDNVVDRGRLRDFLTSVLEMLASRPRGGKALDEQPTRFAPAGGEAWTTVQLARHAERPTATDYIAHFSDSFVELRGDRSGVDDRSVVCGLGMLGAEPALFVGYERPRSGGAARLRSAGLRKAVRGLRLAERLRVPAIVLLDSLTAAPDVDAESSGLGAALAEALLELERVETPVVAVIIGEAHGETALALGAADRLLMLQNAVYEPVSPETAATIIYRDAKMAGDVAQSLRLTASDLRKLGIADAVVPEPAAGAHSDHEAAARLLSTALLRTIADLRQSTPRKLAQARQARYRRIGQYSNYLGVAVGQGVAQLGGDIANAAGGAIARLTRRPRSGSRNALPDLDERTP
jgi:acyl-CoA carboxylase subunit beta